MNTFKRDVIFDETINNRRFIVTRNGFDLSPEERKLFVDLARDWYCGYMEIKTADEEYKYFKSDEADDSVDEYEDAYFGHIRSAIGGITLASQLDFIPEDSWFIGFDTNHFFSRDVTANQVIEATLNMQKDLKGKN